jgi:tRNA threonylcarbamoyl adenosine modification protein (Sua5/YciO/YrdC/YwlC family)
MEVIDIDRYNVRGDHVRQLADALRGGQLVGCPTDTTYAIIAASSHPEANERLSKLRLDMAGSEEARLLIRDKRPSLVFSDITMLSEYVVLSQSAFLLVKRLLPGPYTVILPATREVPKRLQDKRRHIGGRIPDDDLIIAVVRELGEPVIATTAKHPDGSLIDDVLNLAEDWPHRIDKAVDAGWFVPEESTVLAVEDGVVEVIRQGKGALPE